MRGIENGVINNLLVSLVVSLLISIEKQLPDHSKKARTIKKLEEAIKEFGALDSLEASEDVIVVGVKIWNKCIRELQEALENYSDDTNEAQLELFQDN
jgi:hypothetical protein